MGGNNWCYGLKITGVRSYIRRRERRLLRKEIVMLKSIKFISIVVCLVIGNALTANAFTINGQYASLISCDYGYSAVRGESGYTGTYDVLGEIWTVYFGDSFCEY